MTPWIKTHGFAQDVGIKWISWKQSSTEVEITLFGDGEIEVFTPGSDSALLPNAVVFQLANAITLLNKTGELP